MPANPEDRRGARGRRSRRTSPRAASTLKDARAGNASFHRYYIVPSYVTAKPGEAEALDLLMKILADGSTSRLYRKLVVEDKVAADDRRRLLGLQPRLAAPSRFTRLSSNGNDLTPVEAAVDGVLAEIRQERRHRRSSSSAPRRRCWPTTSTKATTRRTSPAATAGPSRSAARSPKSKAGRRRIAKVTTDDIKKAADNYLDARRSVTGWLLPEPDDGNGAGEHVEQPVAHSRS